jgi:hypothetical protein
MISLLVKLGKANCLIGVLHILLHHGSRRCKNWYRATYPGYLKGEFFSSYDGENLYFLFCIEVLTRIVVVLWRDFVYHNYCIYQGQHWDVSTSDMYENISKMHRLDCYNSLNCLQHRLHLCGDLPMLPNILLLGQISWWVRQMHSNNRHCRHDVCTWSYFYMVGLDVGYSTGFLGLEFEYKSPH